jgi:hypothetical protein
VSKRGRGHYCWCCGRVRPNERFSGRNHARHLCRDCARLGAAELRVRQVLRNIDRLLGYSGLVRRRDRPVLETYLRHDDERVRRRAAELLDRSLDS